MEKFPQARRERLVVQELPDELLIYDQERDKAHCLNQSAALVWKHCDGKTSIAEISRMVSTQLKSGVDERAVWFAISQLTRDHLLEEQFTVPAGIIQGMNRRQMVRTLGLAAAVAVPVVTSIVAPTPAQAATCLPSGSSCTASSQCCSGLCNAGTCA
jgi:hypothetical protein